MPRTNGLYRTNARGGGELIAANVSLLLVVIAPLPRTGFVRRRSLSVRRRSAAACALRVVLNKWELPLMRRPKGSWQHFAAAGYRLLRSLGPAAAGLDAAGSSY